MQLRVAGYGAPTVLGILGPLDTINIPFLRNSASEKIIMHSSGLSVANASC